MTNFYGYSALAASIITLFIGFYVLYKNPRNSTNLLFLLINIPVSVWCFSSYIFSVIDNQGIALFWNKVAYFCGSFIPVFFLHFISNITGLKKKHFVPVFYLLSTIIAFASLSDYFVPGMAPRLPIYKYLPQPNILYGLFVLYFVVVLVIAYLMLTIKFFKSKGTKRNQYLYLAIASIIGFMGTMDMFLTVYNIHPRLPFPHDILIIAYTFMFAYAITKTHLLDISVIVTKTAAYIITIAVYSALYLLLFYLTNYFQADLNIFNLALLIYLAIVGLTFNTLRLNIQTTADKTLLKSFFNIQKSLSRINEELLTASNIENIRQIINGIGLNVDVDKVRLFFPESYMKQDGEPGKWVELIDKGNYKTDEIIKTKENLLYKLANTKICTNEEAGTDFHDLEAELCFACNSDKGIMAVIAFGKKMSGDSFSAEELAFFNLLIPSLTLVLERIRPYEQMQDKAKMAEEELIRTAKLSLLGEVAAGVAHEIRNPLSEVTMRLQFMRNQYEELGEKVQKADMDVRIFLNTFYDYSKNLETAVKRALTISDELMDFGRKKELKLAKLNINELLDETIKTFYIASKTIRKEYGTIPEILGDKNKLVQVFTNLIGNARRAVGDQGLITFKTYADDSGKLVFIDIADNGPGIPPKDMDKLFIPFYTKSIGGTGLGLAVSHRIVTEHQGTIKVKSEIGKGTTFTISLPVDIHQMT